MNKLIINFAPTGMIPTKADNSNVPITPGQIVEDIRRACELGITMVHLHARDSQTQKPTYKKEVYAEIIGGIREFAPDLVLCVSTSGRTFNEYAKRADVLQLQGDLKPDMASLTLSSLNFNKRASLNEPAMIMDLAREMLDQGIKPEAEAFDTGMLNYMKYLIRKRLLMSPYYINLIFGNIACAQADFLHVGVMVNDLPQPCICSMGAVGNAQLQINSLAVCMGYGIRVGLEDNIWYDNERTKPASNRNLLERVHMIARVNQRDIMTAAELRDVLKLKKF